MLGIFYLHKSEEKEESELFFFVYSSEFWYLRLLFG